MSKVKIVKDAIKVMGDACKKYLPSILIGVGISGFVAGTVVAIKATPAAHEELKEQAVEEEQVAEMLDREPKKDVWARVKIIFKHYWSTMVLMVSSAGCIVIANLTHLKREAALLCLAASNKKELEKFKKKVLELDGEKKLTKLKDALASDDILENPTENTQVIVTGNGDHLCYDAWSGRYFYTDIEKVRRAQNDMNRVLLKDGYYSVNDFYDSLGLPNIDLGDYLGWHLDRNDEQVEINFTSKVTDKGEPCLVIRFDILPTYQYDSYG